MMTMFVNVSQMVHMEIMSPIHLDIPNLLFIKNMKNKLIATTGTLMINYFQHRDVIEGQ
jgi:hypothetical protein